MPAPGTEPGPQDEAASDAQPRQQDTVASGVAILIAGAAASASVGFALAFAGTVHSTARHPREAATFLLVTLVLQLFTVEVYGRGSLGVSAIGLLAAGFAVGAGPAMAIALLAAAVQWGRRRGSLHKAIFDAANFALAAGTAALVYHAILALSPTIGVRIVAATLAGGAYAAVNAGLLSLAMGLSETIPVREIWRERFHWARYHFLAFGPLAFASTLAYERIGVAGPLAFALPPALLVFSMRQYLQRTRTAVEEVREANAELSRANTELAARNDDLYQLFEFAGGLAARTHDRGALVEYAQDWLTVLTGVRVQLTLGEAASGEPLVAAGKQVGGIEIEQRPGFQRERWLRLRATVLPQLATAVESAELVEEVKRTHLATIAALSRSIEAKDDYTGGHTERVAGFSVGLAKRLGFAGSDLDAVEIGALLHDIGKIGIPETILHKPGPLDEDEMAVMREHPVLSETILAEADLPPIVRQIARHHHERMDGTGYPDRLAGEGIPLAARIVHVADAFDALTTDRPYRRGRHAVAALEALSADQGTQFCPVVVATMHALYREEPELFGSTELRAIRVA